MMIIRCIRVYRFVLSWLFLFQAEDGIRDLVRSRGLGDVYKRQRISGRISYLLDGQKVDVLLLAPNLERFPIHDIAAVSYTHLTLPTSDLV